MTRDGDRPLSWRARRAAFNHDWLKTPFLVPLLANGLGLLRGEFDEEGFAACFPERVVAAWEKHHGQASRLVDDFEIEMSPRALVARPPLSRLKPDVRSWLGATVHACWLARGRKQNLLDAVREAEREADAAFQALRARFATLAPITGTCDLIPALPELEAFDARCRRLSSALSCLPNRIEVA